MLAATSSEFRIIIENPTITEILDLLTALISSFRSSLISAFMTFIFLCYTIIYEKYLVYTNIFGQEVKNLKNPSFVVFAFL
jgi:hypothetical protein